MSKQDPLIIQNNTIKPGTRRVIELSIPEMYDLTAVKIPITVVHGAKPGPILCIMAAVHGDEVNGIEIIRTLLQKKIFKNFSGTLIAIPIVNVYGFLNQSRYLPDRRDLNRMFPGAEKGSLAARLAHLLSKEILSKVTHCIDLHTGSLHKTNLPQIRVSATDSEAKALAESFNAPVILKATVREGSVREYAHKKGISYLIYEAGGPLRFDKLSIRIGVKGCINVMQSLKMMASERTSRKKMPSVFANASYWIRASNSGILRHYKALGKRVLEGDLLARISNPMGSDEYELRSPISGIIIGINDIPMVYEGEALYHIACVEEITTAIEHLEYLQEKIVDEHDE